MVAANDQMTPRRDGGAYGYPVKGATRIFSRTLVAVTATGLAVPGGTAGAVAIVGVAAHHADNRFGPDADGKIRVDREVFTFAFSGTAPTFANIGASVYAVDDNTVSLDSSAGVRLKAGTLDGIEDGTPWIRV
jgi:hypothetical protein